MHELPVVTKLLEAVLERAEREGAVRVTAVELLVGGLHDLIPEWIERYFAFASRGTLAEGAEIRVITAPVIGRCRRCGESFVVDLAKMPAITCASCGGEEFFLLAGREFELRKIEVVLDEHQVDRHQNIDPGGQ